MISLQHAIAAAPNAKKKAELQREETSLLQSAGRAILGDLARAGRPTRFEWKAGFIDHAVIASPTHALVLAERLETLFSLPAGRSLTRLTLHAEPTRLNTHQEGEQSVDDVVDPWVRVAPVLAQAPASLTHLAFGEAPPSGAAAYVALPDLTAVARALPRLTHLELQGAGGGAQHGLREGFDFPQLRSLEVRLASANPADLAAISLGKLPALETLTVSTGGNAYTDLDSAGYDPYDNEDGEARYPDTYPASDLDKMELYDVSPEISSAQVGQWLAQVAFPSLRSLTLDTPLRADLITALAAAPVLRSLTTLRLSGRLTTDALEALFAHKARFAHLRSLALRLDDLPRESEADRPRIILLREEPGAARPNGTRDRLEQAFPMLQAGPSESEDFVFRFVATME